MVWDPMNYKSNYSYRAASSTVSDYNYGDVTKSSSAAAQNSKADMAASGGASIASAAAVGGPWAAAAVAAYQIFSGAKQADSIRRQAELVKKLNNLNAEYVEYDAWQAEAFGQTQEARYDSEVTKAIGEQRVGYAAAGVDVNYGTASEVQGETRLVGVLNKMEIQNEANAKALGLRRQANNIRYSATVESQQGEANAQSAMNAGIGAAANTGLSAYLKS